MVTNYTIASNVIGLIVRGKLDDAHSPDKMAQHADCILPGGEPVGFYGGGGDASSGSSGSNSLSSWQNGPSAFWNRSGLNMKGKVAYYNDMLQIRPNYVNMAYAVQYNTQSTVFLLKVNKKQADLFKSYWANLKLNPGAFNILGANCSTHASEAFIKANVVSSGIPGLDTPDNLYKQLKTKYSGQFVSYSGFIAAQKNADNYDLLVE